MNVRGEEFPALLDLGSWREAMYEGYSWNPVLNRFYEQDPAFRDVPLSFDRILKEMNVESSEVNASRELWRTCASFLILVSIRI